MRQAFNGPDAQVPYNQTCGNQRDAELRSAVPIMLQVVCPPMGTDLL